MVTISDECESMVHDATRKYGDEMGRWVAMVLSIGCLRSRYRPDDRPHLTRDALDRLAKTKGASEMERVAAAFCVAVFNGEALSPRTSPRCEVINIAARGDEQIRRAVAGFIADPFWP